MIAFTVKLNATQKAALEAMLPEISGALNRLKKAGKTVSDLRERLAKLEIEYKEVSVRASELVDRASIQEMDVVSREKLGVEKKIDSANLDLTIAIKTEGQFIGPAHETLRAITAPSLTSQLRAAVGAALSPFFNDLTAAAAETHRTPAVMALGRSINSLFMLRRDTKADEVENELTQIVERIEALLAGRAAWQFKGVKPRPEKAGESVA